MQQHAQNKPPAIIVTPHSEPFATASTTEPNTTTQDAQPETLPFICMTLTTTSDNLNETLNDIDYDPEDKSTNKPSEEGDFEPPTDLENDPNLVSTHHYVSQLPTHDSQSLPPPRSPITTKAHDILLAFTFLYNDTTPKQAHTFASYLLNKHQLPKDTNFFSTFPTHPDTDITPTYTQVPLPTPHTPQHDRQENRMVSHILQLASDTNTDSTDHYLTPITPPPSHILNHKPRFQRSSLAKDKES